VEDQLLLFELLFNRASRELRSLSGRSLHHAAADITQDQAMFEIAASTSRVRVRVSLPQAHLSAKQIADVQDAIGKLLVAAGLSDRRAEPPEFGSFFQQITLLLSAPFVTKLSRQFGTSYCFPHCE
jgi:hypothetical protein